MDSTNLQSQTPVVRRPHRKSGVVVPHKPKWHQRLAQRWFTL